MTETKQENNVIVKLTFDFALAIIDYSEQLRAEKKFIIADQLFRSGTSIGANTREAQNAESKLDFIHKFKIAAEEADETQYWLELCRHSKHYPSPGSLIQQLDPVMKVLNKIIATSKKKRPVLYFLSFFI